MATHKLKELEVWQRSLDLVKDVYAVTAVFEVDEKCKILEQLQCCALSIPSHIAEGEISITKDKQFKHFIEIAMSYCAELHTQLIFTSRCNYISGNIIEKWINAVKRINEMLLAFYNSLGRGNH